MDIALSDQINIFIAIATFVAALTSCIAAYFSRSAAKRNEILVQANALEEKDRWLTDILFSLANQCNQCVDKSGSIVQTASNVSRMVTILYNAIQLVKLHKRDDNRKPQLYNLWIFLHSSIWVELNTRDALLSVATASPEMLSTLSSQYEYVRVNLVNVVN